MKYKSSMVAVLGAVLLAGLITLIMLFWWFEGERPHLVCSPPEIPAMGKEANLRLEVSDKKRGLKRLVVSINQGGKDIVLIDEKYEYKGILNRNGAHEVKKDISVRPHDLKLAQGPALIMVKAYDYSLRNGGDGNVALIQIKTEVDTIPPTISNLAPFYYF